MSATLDTFNTDDRLDFCVQIINAENKQGKEIIIRIPQIWKIVHLDNQSTIGNYEAHITFETPEWSPQGTYPCK